MRKKTKDHEEFINDKGRICKNCNFCLQKVREYAKMNPEKIKKQSAYQRRSMGSNKRICRAILVKKVDEEAWMRYETISKARKDLNIGSNIYSVLKGEGKYVCGYECKYAEEDENKTDSDCGKTWKQIADENGYSTRCMVIHEEINGELGKKCFKCKELKKLDDYYHHNETCDKLRGTCKKCYNEANSKQKKYRRSADIEYKILCNARRMILNVIKGNIKGGRTRELIGCNVDEYMDHIEKKFDENMSWKNHGTYWEIDHIFPCSSWNMSDPIEQKACFNYLNVQPLEKSANMSKCAKYIKSEKDMYFKEFLEKHNSDN